MIRIIITCNNCEETIHEGFDTVNEKYPFNCDECGDLRHAGSYPFTVKTEVV